MTQAPDTGAEAPAAIHTKLEALAAEGEHVADGKFTLDPAQARAKLREYQLEDPAAYVLLLVEAAWLAGLSGIRSEIRFEHGTTTSAEFSGLELDARTLSGLLATVFAATGELEGEALQQARATQVLGLALNAALGLDASELRIEHEPVSGERLSVRFDGEGQPTLERGPNKEWGPRTRTRVIVAGGALDLRRGPREAELLRERAAFASFPVISDGKRISRGLHTALEHSVGPRCAVSLSEPRRVIGAACFLAQTGAPAQLLLITRGVLSERVPLVGYPADFCAVIEADLRKDLSQRQVLRDASFRAVLDAIDEALVALPEPAAHTEAEPEAEPESDSKQNEFSWPGALIMGFWLLAVVFGTAGMFDAPVRWISPQPQAIEVGQRWQGELACEDEDFDVRLEISAGNSQRGVLHVAEGQQAVYLRGSHLDDKTVHLDFDGWVLEPDEALGQLSFELSLDEDELNMGGFVQSERKLMQAEGRDDCYYLSLAR